MLPGMTFHRWLQTPHWHPIDHKPHQVERRSIESVIGSSSLCVLQGLKMTDGLKSLAVCNNSFVEVRTNYSYRSYELLTVQVSLSTSYTCIDNMLTVMQPYTYKQHKFLSQHVLGPIQAVCSQICMVQQHDQVEPAFAWRSSQICCSLFQQVCLVRTGVSL